MKRPGENYFLTWEDAFKSGTQSAGGKGWNLGRLVKFGFNIPTGGVLTTKTYNEFISYNRLQEPVRDTALSITAENINETSCQEKLRKLRGKILQGSVPLVIVKELTSKLIDLGIFEKPLAVRSSAAAEDSAKASFAGIHESFLNISGLDHILEAVKGCYASLWSPQAVVYRRKLNIGDDDAAAVVVMEMVAAQAAGVGFTCDPQTGRQDLLTINANFGLGESVVTGAVEPDTYYLDAGSWSAVPRLISRKTGRKERISQIKEDRGTEFIESPELSTRQVLSDKEIEKLGLLLLRVFEALGNGEQHQDVEWVFDGRDFVLVQARPVTAVSRNTFAALKHQTDIWSNGNLRDALPMVQSPLNRRLMKNFIETDLQASFTEIGYRLPEGLEFSRYFNGRLYLNLSVMQWGMFDCMGVLPRDFNTFWGGHQPEIELKNPKPYQGLAGLKKIWYLIKAGFLINRLTKNASEIHTQVSCSVEALTKEGLTQLQDREFINLLNELSRITSGFAKKFWFLSGAATAPIGSLLKVLSKYFGDRAPTVLNALMVGGEARITSADQGYRLVELAEIARQDNDALRFFEGTAFDPFTWEEQLPEGSPFKQAFREFIREFGHRAVYELDIINPRWKEDPSYLLDIIRSTKDTADLNKLKAAQTEKCEAAWREIKDKVPFYRRSSVRNLVAQGQSGAAVREMTKSMLAKAMESYRLIARELGTRLRERAIIERQGDIYFCTWPELFSLLTGDWDGTGLQALIADRKTAKKEMESISPPDIIFGDTPRLTEPVIDTSSNWLQGVPVAAGRGSGIARLIYHPDEGNRLQPGEVLVAPSTDPGWTPLFLKAGAVIMETGGFLSHGAIVAREYGIPAVVNIPGIMRVIKDGQQVIVSGDEGKISISAS